MRTVICLLMTVISCFTGRIVSAAERMSATGTVTYVTSRSVYVRLDQALVLASGDTVRVGLSSESYMPTVVKATGNGKVVLDRSAELTAAVPEQTVYIDMPVTAQTPSAGQSDVVEQQRERSYIPAIPLDGRLAVQYYRYRGENGNIEYDQPSIYFDLRSGSTSSPLEVSLRFRSRLQRELALPSGRNVAEERTDRLYDLAATYRSSRYVVSIGRTRRIGDTGMGGLGGLDGIMGEYRIRGDLTGGVFAGAVPELDNFTGDRRETKTGLYLVWSRHGEVSYEIAIAYIHGKERNSPETSTLYLEQQYTKRGLRITGETALIVNRSKTEITMIPENKTLQNARVYLGWTVVRWLRFSLNYAGYLVREYRDLNQPFDPVDMVRYDHAHTVQSRTEITLPQTMTISGEILAGENHYHETGLLSFAVRSRISNIMKTGISSGLSYIQTEQGIGTGHHLLLNISQTFFRLQCNVNGSITSYSRIHSDEAVSQRLQVSLFYQLGSRFYTSMQATRNWDETITSNTFFFELGTRFGAGGR